MPSDRSPPGAEGTRFDDRERRATVERRTTRRRVLGTLAVLGSIAVAGCSGRSPLGGPDPVWRRSLPDASGASPPAVGAGRVLVGGRDKKLHALRVDDGETAFAFETGGPIEARPVAGEESDGLHHVRSTDGDVYGIDRSGDEAWHREGVHERGSLARSGPLLVENVPVYDDPTVRGFDAATGDVRFELPTSDYRLRGLTAAGFAVASPPERDFESRTRIAVLSLTDGRVRWEADPIPSHAVLGADEELVVTYHGSDLTAYETSDGTVRWRRKFYGPGRSRGPELGSQLYLTYETDAGEGVAALDRADGTVRWREPIGYQVRRVEPAGDAVFVGSRVESPDGEGVRARVDCFEPDGRRRWKTTSELPDVDDLVVAGDRVVLSSERRLDALDRATGATHWQYEPDSSSRLGLATGDESLYVSRLDDGAVAKFPP